MHKFDCINFAKDQEISNYAVDAFTVALNHMEIYREPGTRRRFFAPLEVTVSLIIYFEC